MFKLATFAILEAHPPPIWGGPNFIADEMPLQSDGEDVYDDKSSWKLVQQKNFFFSHMSQKREGCGGAKKLPQMVEIPSQMGIKLFCER